MPSAASSRRRGGAAANQDSGGIVLAFDLGKKKTGVAIGNTITGGARPLAVVRGAFGKQRPQLDSLIKQWQPRRLIFGLPCHMDGKPHAMTRWCRTQGEALAAAHKTPHDFQDERLTSILAKNITESEIDSNAAAILLQEWLDSTQ